MGMWTFGSVKDLKLLSYYQQKRINEQAELLKIYKLKQNKWKI